MYRGDINKELNHYHPQGKEIIEAYVEGVNKYISDILKTPEKLPLPFKMLDIIPEKWTPEVVISRHQGLLGNIEDELEIGRTVALIGEKKVKDLDKGITAGLFNYPILMAADILIFDTDIVPVGSDQKQHIEMTRDIAMRFNNFFGQTLIIPEPDIEKETQLIPGVDGKKMSKSYDNTIPLFDSEKIIRKKVMAIITDTADIDEPKDKDTPLFQLYSLFLDKQDQSKLSARYDGSGLRYGDVKKELFQKVMDHFQPFREKRASLISRPKEVRDVLRLGAKKANIIAEEVLDRVKSSVGMNYIK